MNKNNHLNDSKTEKISHAPSHKNLPLASVLLQHHLLCPRVRINTVLRVRTGGTMARLPLIQYPIRPHPCARFHTSFQCLAVKNNHQLISVQIRISSKIQFPAFMLLQHAPTPFKHNTSLHLSLTTPTNQWEKPLRSWPTCLPCRSETCKLQVKHPGCTPMFGDRGHPAQHLDSSVYGRFLKWWVFSPQKKKFVHRVFFHDFHHPFWGKHPCFFRNTHIWFQEISPLKKPKKKKNIRPKTPHDPRPPRFAKFTGFPSASKCSPKWARSPSI